MPESKDNLSGGRIPAAALAFPLRSGQESAWKPTAKLPGKIEQAKVKTPIPIDFLAKSRKRKPPKYAESSVQIRLQDQRILASSLRSRDGNQQRPCDNDAWSPPAGEGRPQSSVARILNIHKKTIRYEVKRRKQAEERLCESQRGLRLVIDSSFNGIWDHDLANGGINYGITWYRNLGYKKNEIPAGEQAWQALVHPDDLRTVLVMHSDLAQGLASQCEIEYRIKDPDGEWRWLLSRGRILSRDDAGKVKLVVGIDTDITRLKQVESAAQAAKAEMERQVMEKTTELIVMRHALKVLLRTQQAATIALPTSDLPPGQVRIAGCSKNKNEM